MDYLVIGITLLVIVWILSPLGDTKRKKKDNHGFKCTCPVCREHYNSKAFDYSTGFPLE